MTYKKPYIHFVLTFLRILPLRPLHPTTQRSDRSELRQCSFATRQLLAEEFFQFVHHFEQIGRRRTRKHQVELVPGEDAVDEYLGGPVLFERELLIRNITLFVCS